MAYKLFLNGIYSVIRGRLGSDVVVEQLGGKRCAKVGIVVPTSERQEDGSYEEKAIWYNVAIFDNGGATTEFLDAIEKPKSDGFKFNKGNSVEFHGMFVFDTIEGKEGKIYKNVKLEHFFALAKVLNTSKKKEDTAEETSGGY